MGPWFTEPPFLNLIDCTPKPCYHEVRFEKDSRYYVIRLTKDLLEDWVITLINGRINSKLGQSRTLAFAGFREAFDYFCVLAQVRFQRGYHPKNIRIDNYLILYLLPVMIHVEHKNEPPKTSVIKNKKNTPKLGEKSSYLSSLQLGFTF
jgi:hypothetical protein